MGRRVLYLRDIADEEATADIKAWLKRYNFDPIYASDAAHDLRLPYEQAERCLRLLEARGVIETA